MNTTKKLILFFVSLFVITTTRAQCDASNSPTFQVATTMVTPAINGYCGTQMNIQNAATFPMPRGPVSYTILAPGQSSVTIPEYTMSSTAYNPGIYTLQVMDNTSSCITSQTIQINSPQPTLSLVASNTLICAGYPVDLSVSGASTYVWSNNTTTASISVSPGSNTTYSVKGTGVGGCPNTAVITISVMPSPSLSAHADQISFCLNQAIQLTAQGAVSYTWNSNETEIQFVSPVITTTGSTTFSVLLQGTGTNGCSSTKTVSLSVWVESCVGISYYERRSEIKIYPNPAHDILTIETEVSELKIFDLTGKEIISVKNSNQINVSQLPKGIYLLKTGNEVKKFLKE